MAVMLRHLTRQPLWYDEIATVSAARRSLGGLIHLLGHTDAVLGGYYLFMHGWTALGTSTAWVRLPSVLGGVAAVAVTALAGVRLRGPVVGAAAGLLLATNPFFLSYAQDARPYTLVALACAVGGLVLVSGREAGPGRRWTWTAAAVAALYLHLFSALVVAVQAGWLLRVRERRRWLAPLAVVATASLPLVWVAVRERGEIGWISPARAQTYLDAWVRLAGGHWPAVVDAVLVVGRGDPRHRPLTRAAAPVLASPAQRRAHHGLLRPAGLRAEVHRRVAARTRPAGRSRARGDGAPGRPGPRTPYTLAGWAPGSPSVS